MNVPHTAQHDPGGVTGLQILLSICGHSTILQRSIFPEEKKSIDVGHYTAKLITITVKATLNVYIKGDLGIIINNLNSVV